MTPEDKAKAALNIVEVAMERLRVEQDGWQKLSDAYAINGGTMLAEKFVTRARMLGAVIDEIQQMIDQVKEP